ncbi:GNAT family N-acetyltransferase [Gleimia hominis]|uniref:GNAT family N-acetyltransferase n=1 Tax=Gleimia hominis TaxID=595468 RepID=A0ABU3IB83_9ACTO|nr:GNAT family N-acetyltransferase [Gleimia hominis]MDT3767181.1 GNAT family N-acetyltransferase [Gleimia hominis]
MGKKPLEIDLGVLTSADAFAVLALERTIFTAEAWSEALVLDELTRPDRLYVGSYESGELVAYGGVRLAEDTDLMTLGVAEAARGKGLGRAVLEELLRRVQLVRFLGSRVFHLPERVPVHEPGTIEHQVRRVQRVLLEVRASNAVAQRLYESVGFRRLGTIRGYYHEPREDALVMACRIAPNLQMNY